MSGLTRQLRSRQSGLSLIELMVSITIGLIILTGVAYVFINTSDARRELERTSRQLENGRFAIDVLQDDLRLAGFYGELSVGSISSTTVPPTAVPTAPPDPCSTAQADWNQAIHVHLQGYAGGIGAPTSCLTSALNILPGTDILVVRRARTCVAGSTGCGTATNGLPYIQVGMCATVVTTHEIGLEGTASFPLLKKDCTTPANKRQYYVNIYYVSTDNGSGVNVPTLKRLTFTGAGFTVDPLVEGIEQFHVEYGLDTTVGGDGSPDVYVRDPNNYPEGACSDSCKVTNWMNAVTVRVFVISRSLETSPGYSDAKSYPLGDAGTVYTAAFPAVTYTPATADRGYRRHAYSALVRITNPAGRRDVP
jgi:type IV pilus assembly protein PilW